MYVKWTLAPSGFYIGLAEFNNKHYYASGRTVDLLEKNMKRSLYMLEKVSATQVHLEQSRSESLDLQYASKVFMSKFVKSKKGAQPAVVNKTIVTPPKPQVEYVCEQHGDEMVVFEMKEVARYKVHKPIVPAFNPSEVLKKPLPASQQPYTWGDGRPQVMLNASEPKDNYNGTLQD